MPPVRIDTRRGKSLAYRKAICDGICRAMTEPKDDRFMIVDEHDADNFVQDAASLIPMT